MSEATSALHEDSRSFAPSPEFTAQANAGDLSIYDKAAADPEAFWAGYAEQLDWFQKWTKVLDWNAPHAKWFVDGKLNVSYNCVDRHAKGARADKVAMIFEGEPGDVRKITYAELYDEVNRLANALKSLGVTKGDRVSIYLPMIPELPISLLACTRIGAIHSVVFGGFSVESLRDRVNDCGAKLIITSDGGWRRGNVVALKKTADEAAVDCPNVEKMVVVKRIGAEKAPVTMEAGRDFWYDELLAAAEPVCEPEWMDSEDPLFVLYTSGSTGKPKGIQHTTGGYLTGVYTTSKLIFDLKDNDIFWCTADVGWVTGHSYIVYGPLANGATMVVYEGSPDTPARDRFWRVIEKHKVTVFYTAPTAIRTFMKWGDQLPNSCDLSTIRLMGTVGEPINPEAWLWYNDVIGKGKAPICDTWWQTETGHIMIAPLPGLVATKPGSATRPFPGITADVVNDHGDPVPVGTKGYLVVNKPWPGMLRTLWQDDARYKQVYWSRFPGRYLTGDGAVKDADGYFWLMGRIDDIMLVAGHNISTMELESALVEHPAVAEAAVIGKAHDVKGQSPVAFVIVREGYNADDALATELKKFVGKKLGPVCRPDDILFTADLPKTRSGKIMRRLLRDIAEGRVLGDTTTLADPNIVASLKDKYTSDEG
ncbi:MAG: acetate--CoA ligase [Armatimonadetes bacterium]|nr:acetate--CoA ligase [Armatimonadota bacterium]